MTRRTDRIGNLLRNTLGEILLTKLSDPRIEPARVSIIRVEVLEDLLSARVYVSVMGTEGEQRRTMAALKHAAGHIQELMGRQISLRTTPTLEFRLDETFKKTLQTWAIIEEAMREIRDKDRHEEGPDENAEPAHQQHADEVDRQEGGDEEQTHADDRAGDEDADDEPRQER